MGTNNRLRRETLTQEMTALQNSIRIYASYSRAMKNPDSVLCNTDDGRRKGIALFTEMLMEAHTKAVWQRRSIAALGAEWEITYRDQEHQTAAHEMDAMLRPLMDGIIEDILDGIAKGFSVQEVIWTADRAQIGISQVCSRDQQYFGFGIDGTLLYSPTGTMYGSGVRELPEGKFIVSTYGGKTGNRYGQGILSAAWWPYFFKKSAYLYWADGLERFGQPVPVGTFPAGTTETKVEEFIRALQAIQTDYSIAIPEGYVVDIKDGISSGSLDGFSSFASYCDRQISKAILSSTLTVDEGEHGTRAQAVVHQRGEEDILESDLRFVEKCVNNTLIKWIWNNNYDTGATDVAFRFRRKEQLPDQTEIDGYKALISFGVPISTAWLYKRFQISPPQDGEDVIVGGATAGKAQPENGGNFSAPEKGGDQQRDELEAVDEYFKRLFTATLPRLRTHALELCNRIDAEKNFEGALKALDRPQADASVTQEIWTELLEIAYLSGYASHDGDGTTEGMFAKRRKPRIKWDKVPLHSTDALEYLRKIVPVMPKLWAQLDSASKRWAYTTDEAVNIDIVNAFKNEMLEAIQNGEGYAGYVRRIQDLRQHLATNNKGTAKTFYEPYKQKYYQTMYTAHGFARRQALQDDPSAQWWKYVTVGDGKVRPRHAMLDGFTAKRNDPVWNNLFPPIGYNCRCRVVSCEEPKEASSIPDDWKPDKGFETGMSEQTYQGLVAKIVATMKAHSDTNYYRDYLTGSIKTWIDRRLQRFDLYPKKALLPAPALLTNVKGATTTWLWTQMGGRLQSLSPKTGVANAINNVQIHLPNDVTHLLKDERLPYLDYMKATLEDPWEIWQSTRIDPQKPNRPAQTNYTFLAMFNDGNGYIVVVRDDGECVTQYDISAQRIDKARRGKLLYEKK